MTYDLFQIILKVLIYQGLTHYLENLGHIQYEYHHRSSNRQIHLLLFLTVPSMHPRNDRRIHEPLSHNPYQ